jgi:DNA-binding XRE family transcriptional regulator
MSDSGIGSPSTTGPAPHGTLADVVREARGRLQMTQTALGKAAGVTRYTINRIESGRLDPSRSLAKKLAEVLSEPVIARIHEQRGDLAERSGGSHRPRDAELHQLFSSSALDRLVIVLADDLDLLALLERHLFNLPAIVDIVFPTQERQEQLRGGSFALATAWNVQGQINQIFEDLIPGGRLSTSATGTVETEFRLFEADGVRQSFVLAGTASGTVCLTWPTLPNIGRTDDEALPAAVTNDPLFIQRVEDHYSTLIRDRAPLTHLKVMAVVKPSGSAAPAVQHRFSEYFTLGSDTEQAAAARAPGLDAFGFAVALVLVHGVVHRTGLTLGRRVLLPFDPKTSTYELFSAHVSDEDMEADKSLGRSTLTARAATAAFRRRNPNHFVEEAAFRRAACRGLKDAFGIDMSADDISEVCLPHELWVIQKPAHGDSPRLAIVPRLYELDLGKAASGGDDGLEAALLEVTAGVAVGRTDLADGTLPLNDFLVRALSDDTRWFLNWLEELEIVER